MFELDRQAILVRIGALVVALVIAFLVLEAWGITGGIMRVYFNTPVAPPQSTPGEVSVKVLPPPKTDTAAEPDKSKAPPPK